VVYAAFSVYLLLILFMGLGIYRLWGWIASPRYLNWLLLPGTIVSEMAYIFGYLITGGEITRAKLMGGGGGGKGKAKKADAPSGGSSSGGGGSAEPTTTATPGVKYLSPVLASLACILACGAAIYYLNNQIGGSIVNHFNKVRLLDSLPTKMDEFWMHLSRQLDLLRHTTGNWDGVNWRDWHAPLFIYLVTCLSIRLAPVRRGLGATMGAVLLLVGVIIVAGALWKRFTDGVGTLWPLLTYVWVTLLFLLGLTLVVAGITALIRALTAKGSNG
jgi:hypothetical protein